MTNKIIASKKIFYIVLTFILKAKRVQHD